VHDRLIQICVQEGIVCLHPVISLSPQEKQERTKQTRKEGTNKVDAMFYRHRYRYHATKKKKKKKKKQKWMIPEKQRLKREKKHQVHRNKNINRFLKEEEKKKQESERNKSDG